MGVKVPCGSMTPTPIVACMNGASSISPCRKALLDEVAELTLLAAPGRLTQKRCKEMLDILKKEMDEPMAKSLIRDWLEDGKLEEEDNPPPPYY